MTMLRKTLVLAPPSIASHPKALGKVWEMHDRGSTDLQMLDRLAAGLVNLPSSTYDTVLLLADADGATHESHDLLGRDVMSQVYRAMKLGGLLKSQDGILQGAPKTEAILAGLAELPDGLLKPEQRECVPVPLRVAKKKTNGTNGTNGIDSVVVPKIPSVSSEVGKQIDSDVVRPLGFLDFTDDLDDAIITGSDEELINEDDLITEKDMTRPVFQPLECRPRPGKRRRACKDCTCGMKEQIEAEDASKRSAADKALGTLKLDVQDLAELDFTVQGKIGSCGNCALGDAFRCDGCPYIGLPAFRPGEEVRLLNNDIQL